jgi:hypothetical protein
MRPVTTFVRALTPAERPQLQAGLRSADAFTRRRSQLLPASAGRQTPAVIARHLGCAARSIRNAIRAFAAEGVGRLTEKPARPKTAGPVLGAAGDDPPRHLLHQGPRAVGQPRSTWTRGSVARACHEQGWTPRVLSIETVRRAVGRLGVSWRRAKHRITSPDPAYARGKKPAAG